MSTSDTPPNALASDLLRAWDTGAQLACLTDTHRLSDAEAKTTAAEIVRMRQARGERIVGRKIGFTNRTLWPVYGVEAPMWAPMYDSTLHDLPEEGAVPLPALPEPRIEPEIAFRIKSTLRADMDLPELAACIDWMAPGFEIVTSPFPGWRFKLPDCTAAQSLHGAYWVGPTRPLPKDLSVLETFSMVLDSPRGQMQGHARDVLDGPLHALRFLLQELGPGDPDIAPGEIITTGTLTDAGPVAKGETWRASFTGIDLPSIAITFE